MKALIEGCSLGSTEKGSLEKGSPMGTKSRAFVVKFSPNFFPFDYYTL